MSSTDQTIEKQTRRHKGPLVGIALGLIFVALLFIGYLTWAAGDVGSERGTQQDLPSTVITE